MIALKHKKLTSLLFLTAILFIFILSFSSCSSQGKVLMTLGNEKITVNMYQLWLSRVKGAYDSGDETVWDEKNKDGKTYNEVFTSYVVQNVKTFISALYLFDELKLKLPDEKLAEIDETMQTILDERADGSKSTLNSQLSQYGVNYDILKSIYITEAKSNYLQDYLYGVNGTEKITDEAKDEYYNGNYVRIKQIFFYTANKPVINDSGSYTYDGDGHVVTRDYTDEEIAAQKAKASEALEKLDAGVGFDKVLTDYNEDTASAEYPNGYYFTSTSQYVDEVITSAFGMEENTYKYVTSDYGIHIIERLPLEEKGYSLSDNADFFTDFDANMKTQAFTEKLKQYEEKIKINENLLGKYDIKNSASNSAY